MSLHLLTRAGEELAPAQAAPRLLRQLRLAFRGAHALALARVLRLYPAQSKDIAPVLDRHLTPEAARRRARLLQRRGGQDLRAPVWLGLAARAAGRAAQARKREMVERAAAARRRARAAHGALRGRRAVPDPRRQPRQHRVCVLAALDYARTAKDKTLESRNQGGRPALVPRRPRRAARLRAFARRLPVAGAGRSGADAGGHGARPSSAPGRRLSPARARPAANRRRSPIAPTQAEPSRRPRLSRAWCLRKLGYEEAAERHLAAALPHVVGGHYVGEHWLASFALLALSSLPSAAAPRTP